MRSPPLVGMCILCAGAVAAVPARAGDALPDPTQPVGVPAPAATEAPAKLVVSSILHSGARRIAVVNGSVVRVGGRVGPWSIIAIEASLVRVKGPDGELELRVAGPPSKAAIEPVPASSGEEK